MKIAKEFKWEMGHRLTFHEGGCKNLHGHSYKMMIELEGKEDEHGMVMDYYDVSKIVKPVIEKLDHSFMAYENDTPLLEVLEKLNSKKVIVNFESTVENICKYLLKEIMKENFPKNIERIKIRIFETEGDYAEEEIMLGPSPNPFPKGRG